METKELKIEGMHCIGCSNRLEKILIQLEGVESVLGNFKEGKVVIQYKKGKVDWQAIKTAIIDAEFQLKGE